MMEELDPPALKEALSSELRGVVIDFWSPWCAPCRTLKPHLAKLAAEREQKWRFIAINTEAHPQLATEFAVTALPTVVLLRSGKELHRFTGTPLPSAVRDRLDEFE